MDGASDATPAAPPIPPVSAPELLARRLPAEAAGFTRGALVPIRQPQVGVEQAYATPGRTAAAFVQVLRPAGGEQLPQGTSSPAVQQEYQRSVTEAERGTGPHRRLRVANEFNEPEADPIFRCAELEGTYGRQPVQSMICVGAAGGQLLRVRASMPRRTPALADSRAFLREIVSSMRNVPTPPEGG
ncbi:hypothetical protein [Roseococcus sp. YIM B11640]|uniref:hypothetical protein n=1 Tax=Roseococcus sp. YIM B11640 TaxID=3133973 RepID=UPI003C7B6209